MAKQLAVERKICSPVYRFQANGRIEGFHKLVPERMHFKAFGQ